MASRWYYSKDAVVHGPVGTADLRRLASSGGLLPSDLIRKVGMKSWVPASAAKGLFDAATTAQARNTAEAKSDEDTTSLTNTVTDLLVAGTKQLMDQLPAQEKVAAALLPLIPGYTTWTQLVTRKPIPEQSKEVPKQLTYKQKLAGGLLVMGACAIASYGSNQQAKEGTTTDSETTYSIDYEYVREGKRINLNQVEEKRRSHTTTHTRAMTESEIKNKETAAALWFAGAVLAFLAVLVDGLQTWRRSSRSVKLFRGDQGEGSQLS